MGHYSIRILSTLSLALLLLTACGATPAGQAEQTSRSADQVHRAWIAALQGNDRQTAQQLLAPEVRAIVDRALEMAQTELLHSTFLGELQSVDIKPPMGEGAGQIGWSEWKFPEQTECYGTNLAQVDGAWYVTNWGRRNCSER